MRKLQRVSEKEPHNLSRLTLWAKFWRMYRGSLLSLQLFPFVYSTFRSKAGRAQVAMSSQNHSKTNSLGAPPVREKSSKFCAPIILCTTSDVDFDLRCWTSSCFPLVDFFSLLTYFLRDGEIWCHVIRPPFDRTVLRHTVNMRQLSCHVEKCPNLSQHISSHWAAWILIRSITRSGLQHNRTPIRWRLDMSTN